jgi:hypothetical protein
MTRISSGSSALQKVGNKHRTNSNNNMLWNLIDIINGVGFFEILLEITENTMMADTAPLFRLHLKIVVSNCNYDNNISTGAQRF